MLGKFPRRQPLTITVIAVMIAMVLVLVPGASAKPKSKAIRIAETKRTHDKALAEIQQLRLEAELSTRVAALEMAGVALRANKARGAKLEDVFSHAGALGGGRRLRLQLAQAIGQCAAGFGQVVYSSSSDRLTDAVPESGGRDITKAHCLCHRVSECVGPKCSKARASMIVLNKTSPRTGYSISRCPSCSCRDTSPEREFILRDKPHYIVMLNGVEGMGSWRWSIAEVLNMARRMNRTLVLPCVVEGELIQCTNTHANAISTYIDIDKLRRFHPLIISHAEFLAREDKDALWRYTTKVYCMHDTYQRYDCTLCRKCPTAMGLFIEPRPVVQMYGWLTDHVEEAFESERVAFITAYQRHAIRRAVPEGTDYAKNPPDYGVHRWLDYAPSVYREVQRIKKKMRLQRNYIAVHWRSEATNCNYTHCAALLAATIHDRLRMLKLEKDPGARPGDPQCLLVTDIPYNQSRTLWGPFGREFGVPGRGLDMRESLSYFGLHGWFEGPVLQRHRSLVTCAKVDAVLSNTGSDRGLMALYDKVLGEQASAFATCTREDSKLCTECARWRSRFGSEIVQMRAAHQKLSFDAWDVGVGNVLQTAIDTQVWRHAVSREQYDTYMGIHTCATAECKSKQI